MFVLEILPAKKGDAFLLHYGEGSSPKLALIDGGPSGVFNKSIKPRLEEIKNERLASNQKLNIDWLMVSHIDDDHIKGILDLFKYLNKQKGEKFRIQNLWHNSFDDILGNKTKELKSLTTQEIGVASFNYMGLNEQSWGEAASKLVLVSVPQGRQLTDEARGLQIPINFPIEGLILSNDVSEPTLLDPDDKMTIGIVSPAITELQALQEEWDKILEKKGLGQKVDIVAYLDRSVPNLASLVTLVEKNGKKILFTGDARGDMILRDLKNGNYLDNTGKLFVHVLKLPHHGSSNNIELDFFETIQADHYVISGDGSHGNPNVETFEMIFESRKRDPKEFIIHLTYAPENYKAHRGIPYPIDSYNALINKWKMTNLNFNIVWPAEGETSTSISL